jgi:hypothetical protein
MATWAATLSKELYLVFGKTVLVKSSHHQKAQHRTAADQRNRVLVFDFPVAQSRTTDDFRVLLARVRGGMLEVTFARRLVCSTTSWGCLRSDNDLEQIEVHHWAQFGGNPCCQAF